jgi:CRISPR/Cas system-associated exonuclease Cas4 (RecB family)
MIVEKVYEHKKSQIQQWPVNSNRASSLGHPCTRYLVYERTRWQEKTLHDARLQMIFDQGNDTEERVLKDIKEAGLTVIEQQRAFSWPEYQITGHIDAKVTVDGVVYPIEVKSMSPFSYDKTNSVEDMLNSKYAYMRAYPGQMTLYLLMDNKEKWFFICKNKATGAMKEIPVTLDYELGESLLKKAEAINLHVAQKTIPEPIEYDENVCSDCGYNHICSPDRVGKEVDVVDDDELAGLLETYARLKPIAKEYDEVDKRIGEIVNGRDKLLIGDWFVTGNWRESTRYNVPADLKKQYAEKSRYWVKKIQKVA